MEKLLKRKEFHIGPITEQERIHELAVKLQDAGYNADNAVIITVSSEYSSYVGQYIRHYLSINGEVAPGFALDVPYPDEIWDDNYTHELNILLYLYNYLFEGRTVILVEAGVIRGGNYSHITKVFKQDYPAVNIVTSALFENIHSKFKSDFVCDYYDDEVEDLTFWWEKYNKHWR